MRNGYLMSNPYTELPPALARLAKQLSTNWQVTSMENIHGMVRSYLAAIPKSARPDTAERLTQAVASAIAWSKGYRLIAGGYVKHSTRVEVGKTEYIVNPLNIPKRRLCYWMSYRDRYEASNCYVAPYRYWIQPVVVSTVKNWGARVSQIAFGKPNGIPISYHLRDRIALRSEGTRIYQTTGTWDAWEIAHPIALANVTTINMSWGAFVRMRTHGIYASKGFLPLDVVEDESGNPLRVVAIVRGNDGLQIQAFPFEEVRG